MVSDRRKLPVYSERPEVSAVVIDVSVVLKGMDDVQVKAAATDIFSYLVEFSPSMVREFVMQEPQQADDVSAASRSQQSGSIPVDCRPEQKKAVVKGSGCLNANNSKYRLQLYLLGVKPFGSLVFGSCVRRTVPRMRSVAVPVFRQIRANCI